METTRSQTLGHALERKLWVAPAILLVIIFAAVFSFLMVNHSQAASQQGQAVIVSQSEFESQYGMQVKLVALTAAGGMVDVRIKVVDPEKAKTLLNDPQHAPVLNLGNYKVTIQAPEDQRNQVTTINGPGTLYFLYPNSGNAVKTGMPVTLAFGDIHLKPIITQ
jgi:hypothetical protein